MSSREVGGRAGLGAIRGPSFGSVLAHLACQGILSILECGSVHRTPRKSTEMLGYFWRKLESPSFKSVHSSRCSCTLSAPILHFNKSFVSSYIDVKAQENSHSSSNWSSLWRYKSGRGLLPPMQARRWTRSAVQSFPPLKLKAIDPMLRLLKKLAYPYVLRTLVIIWQLLKIFRERPSAFILSPMYVEILSIRKPAGSE